MKKIKYLFVAALMCLAVLPACLLVGCSKSFTINVIVSEGSGSVKKIDSLTHVQKNLLGENEVEEGNAFEYVVAPVEHYHIKYINVDGQNIDFTVDKDGIARPCILNITGNHTISVGFERNTYNITYYYTEDGKYQPLVVDDQVYKTSVVYGWNITIDGFKDFGFTVLKGGNHELFKVSSDEFTIHSDTELYTTKNLEQLKELLGLNQSQTVPDAE